LLTPERHRIILQLLKEKNVVKITEIMELTESSESTIRRDLSQLEDQKFLKNDEEIKLEETKIWVCNSETCKC